MMLGKVIFLVLILLGLLLIISWSMTTLVGFIMILGIKGSFFNLEYADLLALIILITKKII